MNYIFYLSQGLLSTITNPLFFHLAVLCQLGYVAASIMSIATRDACPGEAKFCHLRFN